MSKRNHRNAWVPVSIGLGLVLMLALSTAPEAQAQTLYGSIVGNVTDQTGATIPGADVTATHNTGGQVRRAITNDLGGYDFPTVRAGTWTVKVAMPGFKEYANSNIRVTVNTVSRVNIVLEVGDLAETLTVTSETALLQTDRAEVRAEISEKALKDLPTPIGRNYQGLLGTLAGFRTPTNAHSIPTNPSRALTFNVNGTSQSANDVRIDGASQFDIWLPHITVYIPSLEAIETVNVVTNSFDAEQGLAGGAAINVQIKSGTNDYHGSAFWFHADNALMAKPRFFPPDRRNSKYITNQYGGTIGGPIKEDKLFFFASFEGSPERSHAASFGDIPTMAMREGDFSALLPESLGGTCTGSTCAGIYDPLTGDSDGRGRSLFPGNIIPSERIHPVSKKILDMMPAPMFDGISQNFFASGVFEFDRNVLDSKVDWHVTDKFNMYGRFSLLRYTLLAPTFFGDQMLGRPLAGGNSTHADGGTYGTTIAGTYVLAPTFIVDANFGYTRKDTNSEMTRLDEKVGLDVLGIPGTNGPRQFEGSWPRIQIDGWEQIGITNNFMPYYRRDPQIQVAGNANWTSGGHNVRFGAEVVNQHMNQTQPEFPGANHPAQGGFRFRNDVTGLRDGPARRDSNAMASFVLGEAQRLGRIFQLDEEYTTRARLYSMYIRDRWQVRPNLTFTIGTRWEYFPMPTRADRGVERYNFQTNQMMVCGVGSIPKDCGVQLSKTLFAPRVGLAYRATDSFVIRAGYGITNDPFSLARPHRTNFPMLFPMNLTGPNSFTPVGNFTDGIPLIEPVDFSSGVVDVPSTIAVNSVGPEYDRGYIQSWNLTLQHQLFGGFVGEVAYVATRTVRQVGYLDLNAGQIPGAGNSGRPYFEPYGRTTSTRIFTPIGHSQYDALQAQLNRRFSNGIQVNANYTWSKTLGIAGLGSSDGAPRIKAPEFYHLNRGLSNIHIPHRFNLATIVELPFGAGKPWASNGVGAKILGGWQLNTAMYAQSGTPFSITGGSLNMPGNDQRGDQVAPLRVLGNIGPDQLWFDPDSFRRVEDGENRFGNVAFNSFLGPKQFNLDVGLFRKFQLTEDVEMQFRAEAFNFTNTPHFSNPQQSVTSGTFGQIRGTRNTGREGIDQRIFRFALRFGF
ncbi:MAG: TonB-dependent receptor domain-containing protein [Acidobacteriota bacterium]